MDEHDELPALEVGDQSRPTGDLPEAGVSSSLADVDLEQDAKRRRRNNELLERLLSDDDALTSDELLELAEFVLAPMLSRRRH